MLANEIYRRAFETGAHRVGLKMNKFSQEVTHQVGNYSVNTSSRIQPFEKDINPAGLIRVNIETLDKRPIDHAEIFDLTLQIHEVATANGGTNGTWMYPRQEKGREDRSVFFQYVAFPFDLSPDHRRYLEGLFVNGQIQLADLLQRPGIQPK